MWPPVCVHYPYFQHNSQTMHEPPHATLRQEAHLNLDFRKTHKNHPPAHCNGSTPSFGQLLQTQKYYNYWRISSRMTLGTDWCHSLNFQTQHLQTRYDACPRNIERRPETCPYRLQSESVSKRYRHPKVRKH